MSNSNNKFAPLFTPITLRNGIRSANRFAMAPMLVYASNEDGSISQADYDYFQLRNDTGGMIISGAASVSEEGLGRIGQLTVYDDSRIEGLKKLAEIMKAKGNKAIMQLHNGGREAKGAYQLYGKVYAPSRIEFSFLDYVPEELTHEQILSIIEDFGEGARRAIEAGFDGVEIHGANHYLVQQFLAGTSNKRTDEWGGDFEHRMAFPLAVLKKVKEVAAKCGGKDFIVGFRMRPEEVHGDSVGYTIDDSVKLVDKLIEYGVDYLHVATLDYKSMPSVGGWNEPLAQTIYKRVNGRVPMMLAGSILTPEAALDALRYTDIVSLGRAVLIDPDFVPKIREERADDIQYSVEGRMDKLAFPAGLVDFFSLPEAAALGIKGLTC